MHAPLVARRRAPLSCARALAAAVFVSVVPATVTAQAPAKRYWFSAGAAIGRSGPAQSLGQDQFDGPSAELGGGFAPTGRGLIGLTAVHWRRNTRIGPSNSTFVVATAAGYPFAHGLDNVYLQIGAGVGHGSFPTTQVIGAPLRMNVTRPALMVGLGYDIPASCPIWIGPSAQVFNTLGGRRVASGTGSGASANAVLFQLGLTMRFSHPGPSGACTRRGGV